MATTTTKKKLARPKFDAIWTTRTDALNLAERARTLRQQQNQTIGRLKNQLEGHQDNLMTSLRGIDNARRNAIINDSMRDRRRELAAEKRDTRYAYTRQLAEIAASASGAEELFSSSVALLMRKTIGSEGRSRYLAQIEHSGPEELRHLAIFAAATSNQELAAALVTRVDRLPVAQRPFSRKDLADHLVGNELREVRLALANAQLAAVEGLDADGRFETGEKNPHRTMEIAMLRRRIDNEFAPDEPEAEEDGENDADEDPAPSDEPAA